MHLSTWSNPPLKRKRFSEDIKSQHQWMSKYIATWKIISLEEEIFKAFELS